MTVRHPARLECREVVERVTELLGGALLPEERARLEQHLLVCPPCTLHVAQVRSTIGHLAQLRADDAPGQAAAALVDLFRQWKKRAGNDDA